MEAIKDQKQEIKQTAKINRLPESVAKEFSVPDRKPYKFVHRTLGYIDLNVISIEVAKKLFNAGCESLVKK